jgi:iron complex transport system substrate-binding protein
MKEPFKDKKKPVVWGVCLLVFFIFSISNGGERFTVDEVGRRVLIPESPKRIVSLAPSITETVFALGLNDKIVGVTNYCNYPVQALEKPRIGGFVNPSIENIVFLRPDLVIATDDGNRREVIDKLTELGIPVFVTYPKNFGEILRTIENIGWITGRGTEASRIVKGIKGRRDEIIKLTKDLEKPKVFLQMGESPFITIGRDTLANDLIESAGGLSISRDEPMRYPTYSIEDVLINEPDIIIITSMNPKRDYKGLIRKWSRWGSISAVKRGKVFVIDSELVDRPSPRIIKGLEKLTRIIHPEILKGF